MQKFLFVTLVLSCFVDSNPCWKNVPDPNPITWTLLVRSLQKLQVIWHKYLEDMTWLGSFIEKTLLSIYAICMVFKFNNSKSFKSNFKINKQLTSRCFTELLWWYERIKLWYNNIPKHELLTLNLIIICILHIPSVTMKLLWSKIFLWEH